MPRLKQYSDRRGFYLSGHVPGVGFCTWQIGDEGLAHLASRGIGSNNDILPIDELRDMIVRGLVGTAGSGTSPSPPAPSPEWVKTLADCLIAWSLNGGTDALAKLVCPGSGAAADSRSRCFAASFLAWMEGLDEGTGLVRFAGISAAEFETMAIGDRHELENDPLFRYLIDRGAVGVLWRLSRLCGSVAVRLQAGSECPNEWQADMLLLWLFNRIKECEDRRRTSPRLTGKRRLVAWTSPRIVWAVDVQEVHALLPSQLLPTGVSSVVWTVGQRKTIYPLVRPGPRGRQIEESVSEPLSPSDEYAIEVVSSGMSAGHTRWTIGCPTEPPLLLFHIDGRLVDSEDPDPHPSGSYLALVRPGQEAAVRSLHGVALDENIPVVPIGWVGWTGWRAALSPGAKVPGYIVSDSSQSVRWKTEPPPDPGVCWLEPFPVFLGELPVIRMEPAEAFRGAVVELAVEGISGLDCEPIYLTIGSDIPFHQTGTLGVADLKDTPQLRHRFGRYRLKCHPAGQLDQSPLVLIFTRLPKLVLEYVPDPQRPSAATAVRFATNEALNGLTPGPDTEIMTDGSGSCPIRFVARSISPETAPGVYVRSKASDWEMRIRIGVTRAGLVAGHTRFEGWRSLPFEEIDLAHVELGDRLRIEFHTPPITEDGRLVSRLSGHGELLVGDPLDRSSNPSVFEIPLHRWRDGFGACSSGFVQIRGGNGWFDTVRLVSTEPNHPPSTPPPPPPPTWWQRLEVEVDQAVNSGDVDSTSEIIVRCLDGANKPEISVVASDLLPLAAAQAALAVVPPSRWAPVRAHLERLQERLDLPEAKILAVLLDIRSENLQSSIDGWSLSTVEEVVGRLPNDPGAALVRAECWYRFARSAGGPATGCWRSCMKWSDRYLASGLPENGIAFSDAILLRDLSRMMLGSAPSVGPDPTGLLLGHRVWIDAIRSASRFMRQPWHGRANHEVHPGLGDKTPSVLCREDEALIRVIVGIVTGRGDVELQWPLVAGLPDGYFYALPLLLARYARYRYASGPAVGNEYLRAWAAFQSGDHTDLLDVIAAERP